MNENAEVERMYFFQVVVFDEYDEILLYCILYKDVWYFMMIKIVVKSGDGIKKYEDSTMKNETKI